LVGGCRRGRGAEESRLVLQPCRHPDRVRIEIPGRRVAVIAEQLHGAERDEAWHQITTAAPQFGKYQEQTDRELPVIRLVPKPG